MENYKSPSDAVVDLRKRGYVADFDFEKQHSCLYCEALEITLDPEDFHVDEMYKFPGNAVSGKNSIVFAITSLSGVKGTLVDEYGGDQTAAKDN